MMSAGPTVMVTIPRAGPSPTPKVIMTWTLCPWPVYRAHTVKQQENASQSIQNEASLNSANAPLRVCVSVRSMRPHKRKAV